MKSPKRPKVVALPTDTSILLTSDQVAFWLQVKPRQVERLGVPCVDLGRKTKRYSRDDVLAWLQKQRKAG
ncbi:MAG: helix-turn-helix domain-containing protein [Gemmatimonadaceae bacterium]|nr:helix-turn-helix domain-containing protein [Gemmatimonadaceae bacterium]